MQRIYTMKDIEALRGQVSPALIRYLEERFQHLICFYEDGVFAPSSDFSLERYGEIILAESYEEIENWTFEEVVPDQVGDEEMYLCVFVPNNDLCIDVFIPEKILSADQKERLLNG